MKNEALQARLRRVKLLALDVDGVLTDGGVYVLDNGQQFRRFNIKDGLGIKQVIQKGIVVTVISASSIDIVVYRMKQLGITEVHLGVEDKLMTLQRICMKYGLDISETLYIGDDLTDLSVLKSVGVPCVPTDAVKEVKEVAFYVASAGGGQGVVREICDLLLSSQ